MMNGYTLRIDVKKLSLFCAGLVFSSSKLNGMSYAYMDMNVKPFIG
jgi:hypothetical protein